MSLLTSASAHHWSKGSAKSELEYCTILHAALRILAILLETEVESYTVRPRTTQYDPFPAILIDFKPRLLLQLEL